MVLIWVSLYFLRNFLNLSIRFLVALRNASLRITILIWSQNLNLIYIFFIALLQTVLINLLIRFAWILLITDFQRISFELEFILLFRRILVQIQNIFFLVFNVYAFIVFVARTLIWFRWFQNFIRFAFQNRLELAFLFWYIILESVQLTERAGWLSQRNINVFLFLKLQVSSYRA